VDTSRGYDEDHDEAVEAVLIEWQSRGIQLPAIRMVHSEYPINQQIAANIIYVDIPDWDVLSIEHKTNVPALIDELAGGQCDHESLTAAHFLIAFLRTGWFHASFWDEK
jgi:hypothetical protein